MSEPEGSGLMGLQRRLAEIVTVVYMGVHVGIHVRLLIGIRPDQSDQVLLLSVAIAFYLALFYLGGCRLRRAHSFWGLTLVLAVAAQLVSRVVTMSIHVREAPVLWTDAVMAMAGPVTTLYVWSLFGYSLAVVILRLWREKTEEGSLQRLVLGGTIKDNLVTTVLTIALIISFPALVIMDQQGVIAFDFHRTLLSVVDQWGPAVNIILLGGFLMVYRMTRRQDMKYLLWLFSAYFVGSLLRFVFASPEMVENLATIIRYLWGVSLMLPAVQAYLWLRAVQSF